MRHSGYKIKSDIHCIQSSLSLTRIHAKLFVQRLERLQTNWSVMLGRISCSYFGTSSNTQTNATYIKEHKSIQREKAPQRPKVKTNKGRNLIEADFDKFEQIPRFYLECTLYRQHLILDVIQN